MSSFLACFLNPLLILPFLITYYLRGPMRWLLGAAILAPFPIIGMGYAGVASPPAELVRNTAIATALILAIGFAFSRKASTSPKS